MALNGNLSNFRLGDLLQTLWQNKTWGVLRVQSGGARRELVVSPHGVAILDVASVARSRVEERLLHTRAIDREHYKSFRARENARTPLVELLRQVPGADMQQFAAVVEAEAGEQLQYLLEWTDGTFELLEGDAPAEVAQMAAHDTSSLVLEAARRQDERTLMGDRFPLPAERFIPVNPAPPLAEANEPYLTHFDGVSSLREIADRLTGDFFTTAKIALELEAAGSLRRATWDELLNIGDELGAAGEPADAAFVYDLAEKARDIPSNEALFDLAIRRTAAGDKVGAARTLGSASQQFETDGDFARAAACLREAIALSPREISLRLNHIACLEKSEAATPEELFEACRDLCLVAADRGEPAAIDGIFEKLLSLIPNKREEEATVGRALGQLGKRTAASNLLCKAARGYSAQRKRIKDALNLYQEALTLAPENQEARRAIDKLSKSQSSQRLQTAMIGLAVLIMSVSIALPVRNSLIAREGEGALRNVEAMMHKGNTEMALRLLDQLEASTSNSNILDQSQRLRSEIARRFDERRVVEESETDEWIRKQFAAAADAIDLRQYADAVELYDSILRRRADEARITLVRHRLESIQRKVIQETRRVAELVKAIAPLSRGSVITEPAPLKELRYLTTEDRTRSIGRVADMLKETPLSKARPTSTAEDWLRICNELTAAHENGRKSVIFLERRIEESRELRELEPVLLDARSAEQEGNARDAKRAYVELNKRYPGTTLKPYFEERSRHWTAVVQQLERLEAAITQGDRTAIELETSRMRRIAPNVKIGDRVEVTFEIRTTPAGASIKCDGVDLGIAPLKLDRRPALGSRIEASRSGFEPVTHSLADEFGSSIHLDLTPRPRWTRPLGAAVSAPGIIVNQQWIIADRAGTVTSLDAETGTVRWSKSIQSLGGAAGGPIAIDGRIFVITREARMMEFAPSDGTPGDAVALQGKLVTRNPSSSDRLIAVVLDDSKLQIFDPLRPGSGIAVSLGDRATTAPVFNGYSTGIGTASGQVVVVDSSGNLQKIQITRHPVDSLLAVDSGTWLAVSNTQIHRIELFKSNILGELPSAATGVCAMAGSKCYIATSSEIIIFDCGTRTIAGKIPIRGGHLVDLLITNNHVLFANSSGIVATQFDGTPFWSLPSARGAFFVQLSNGHLGAVWEGGNAAAIPDLR